MGKEKANNALALLRVEDVLRIRLDGAEFWDVREFVREKETDEKSHWFLVAGAEPLSDSQIRRYVQRADRLIVESHERSRKKLLRRHLAWRRNLYARAILTGDLRAALAAASDEAKLLGLYPADKHEHSGPKGGPIPHEHGIDAKRAKVNQIIDSLLERAATRPAAAGPPG